MARMPASTSSPVIRPGGTADLDAVAKLLTEVFTADPLMHTIAARAPKPVAALGHLHRCELTAHYLSPDASQRAGAHVDLAVADAGTPNERLLGVALWDAPAQGRHATGPFGSEPLDGVDLDLLGGAWELVLLDAAQCEAAQPPQPYWYLYMLAVAPGARGSGVGTALLRHGLERVDADGVAAHLESTTPASRRLYERLGFSLAATLDAPPLPVYWALTRPARPRR
ncbi:GNAT family N-acetyltransferase [Actinomyces succiniciruminis]|uniref:Puromycin N-acetyltransferase n=1 Tax=Actinomyces succiniciruminis TaxID=1522002 RepID=A0A1L7RQX6_9ACTO|nr:GNAT family N-acetyltransferase [Actinomyces succiniciruminis]CED92690.1 Puromycin N-acetyltransferase [Actinomyces succiniciruminis]